MWGAALFAVFVATTVAGCWGFGCCGVGWNAAKFCGKAGGVVAITIVGVLTLLFMALTVYHFLYRVFSP